MDNSKKIDWTFQILAKYDNIDWLNAAIESGLLKEINLLEVPSNDSNTTTD